MSYIEEYWEAYEQEYGELPSELVIRIIQHIEKVSRVSREQGLKDAQECRDPLLPGTFVERAQHAFHNNLDEDTAQAIGELWHIEYMNGYKEGGAA